MLCYNSVMLKGLKYIGIAVCFALTCTVCCAGDGYLIVPVPDTIVAPTPLDQAVYTNTAEFFTPYIVNEINKTHYMQAPTVNDVRNKIKRDYWLTKSAAKAMDDFRRYYTLDFNFAKKIGDLYNTNLVLLLTSSIDANNYVMRRTWWTFFEIPGSSALDPALKINIYSVLIDTEQNIIVWSKTYQKTISTVENRIVPVGYTPQTEQLQHFKDYSVYLAPRVAQSLQDTLLTAGQKLAEPNMIHTDYGTIDNVFTKKYRTLRKEIKDATVVPAAKTRAGYGKARAQYLDLKEQWEEHQAQKALEKQNTPKKQKNIEPINFLWFKNKQAEEEMIPSENKPADILVPVSSNEEKKQSDENSDKEQTPVSSPQSLQPQVTEQDLSKPQTVPVKSVSDKPIKTTPQVQNDLTPEPATSSKNTPASIQSKEQTLSLPNNAEKPAVNVTKSKSIQNKNINKINNKSSINKEELPIDALIYTQPTNYREESNYLPVKPRLREINIDDTVNSF